MTNLFKSFKATAKVFGITIIFTIFFAVPLHAQVKVGNNPTVIDDGSVLEIESTNKAFVLPRMTTAQMNAIPTPLPGAIVFNTDVNCSFEYRGATSGWVSNCSPGIIFHVRKSSSQTLGAVGINTITYDATPVVMTPGNFTYNAATGALTVTVAGKYLVTMQTSISSVSDGSQLLQGVINNTTGQWIGRMSHYNGAAVSGTIGHGYVYTTCLDLTAGQTIRFGGAPNQANAVILGNETGGTGTGNVTNVTVLKVD